MSFTKKYSGTMEIAIAKFSFRLLEEVVKLSSSNQNIVLSPISVIATLTFLHNGSKGLTAQQIKQALKLSHISDEKVNELLGNLLRRIDYTDGKVVLLSANQVFLSNKYQLAPAYNFLMKQQFGSTPVVVDFGFDITRSNINSWVEENTQRRIRDIIPSGSIDRFVKLVVVNAMYFRGNWLNQFPVAQTKMEPFYLGMLSSKIDCPMMRVSGEFRTGFLKSCDSRALELRYEAHELSMFIILPNQMNGICLVESRGLKNIFQEVEASITSVSNIEVTVPRFTIESEVKIKEALIRLGIQELFNEWSVDLSGMTGKRGPSVTTMFHKCSLDIIEGESPIFSKPEFRLTFGHTALSSPFIANHPFYFYIKDEISNAVLLTGRLVRPC